jgi:hypothetical protein
MLRKQLRFDAGLAGSIPAVFKSIKIKGQFIVL